jgi:3-deoxy-D-manno-octulosonic acid kinase
VAESLQQNNSEHAERSLRLGKRHILYDASLLEHPDTGLFEVDDASDTAIGRAHAVFYEYRGLQLVLKHYQRGGLVASALGDRYLGIRPEKSRAFREWRLLHAMRQLQLPSPAPVAASVTRHGLFLRADLVTLRIDDSRTLADVLLSRPLDASQWRAVGRCVRRFHDHNIWHADLNARNILLDTGGNVYLIDFDRGRFRRIGETWKAANLARLQRSLLKFQARHQGFNYSAADWQALLEGYREQAG